MKLNIEDQKLFLSKYHNSRLKWIRECRVGVFITNFTVRIISFILLTQCIKKHTCRNQLLLNNFVSDKIARTMGHTNLSRSLQMSGFNSHLHVHAQSFFCRSNYFLLFFFFFSLSFLLLSFYSSSEEDFGPNYDNKSPHYLTTTTTASWWPSGEVRRTQVRTALTQKVQDQPGALRFACGFKKSACYMVGF